MITTTITLGFVYAMFLIFCRVGTAFMYMPIIGDTNVNTRVRLLFALIVSFLLTPIIEGVPGFDSPMYIIFASIFGEILLGLAIGVAIRILFSALHVFGMNVSTLSSLAAASQFDPSQGTQSSLIGMFISLFAVNILLALDFHLHMISAIAQSYHRMEIGAFFTYHDDFSNMIARVVNTAFLTGIKLSMPFMAVSLVMYIGAGILSRLMPQFQVFFILMPVQITIAFFILALVLSIFGYWIYDYMEENLHTVFAGG
jgi:flagellar biosynthetic protein FliR